MIRRKWSKIKLAIYFIAFYYLTKIDEKCLLIKEGELNLSITNVHDNNYMISEKYNKYYILSLLYKFGGILKEIYDKKIFVKNKSCNNFMVSSKVIYGLYNDMNYSKYSNFCFSKNANNGVVILSNLYVPNTKFLILDKSDDEIYNYGKNKNGKTCEDLEKIALFVHPLNDIPPELMNKTYFVYQKDIEKSLTDKKLNFILLNCGNKIKNAFKIEFKNNMNFLKNHFSCEEQGLFEIHMLLIVLLFVLSLVYYRKRKNLNNTNNVLKEAIHCSYLFFLLSNILYFIHLISYAFNGSGFSILKVLSQIYEAIFDCFILVIIYYIFNNDMQKKKEETIRVAFTYSILKFIYILFEIQNNQELDLYSTLHSIVALPFVVYRIIVAVLNYDNSKKLLKEKTQVDEKFYVLFDTFFYNLWILSIPVQYFLMKSFSLHFTHLFVHFFNLYILIYLVYNLSEEKFEVLESKHPYLDLN
ncbi:serpentine receptor [Plasmodium falciparum NF54]|uniref:Serpentine receptor, putative n=3 Tax=Plasmodium (Laverania) TaxID=418107 RepID=C0H4C0_PLAF7|nr:serpentine receptor, putative [Plasmodium falciparum 3D7]KAF4330025.1 serpentine receptor [Plasmodium falciparum NF54]PKC48649.1 serpentine receptor [Plasmodium falciparum NF54]CAX63938.1 serpentine receptor, putative [Plasmodium falciparum 3D7]|eukprot:XP_002808669.1 serpentine receptor, putative [Plasmodium falciparum 3D7]